MFLMFHQCVSVSFDSKREISQGDYFINWTSE